MVNEKNKNRKIIAISDETHRILKELSDKHGIKLVRLVELAIEELQKKLKIVVD